MAYNWSVAARPQLLASMMFKHWKQLWTSLLELRLIIVFVPMRECRINTDIERYVQLHHLQCSYWWPIYRCASQQYMIAVRTVRLYMWYYYEYMIMVNTCIQLEHHASWKGRWWPFHSPTPWIYLRMIDNSRPHIFHMRQYCALL